MSEININTKKDLANSFVVFGEVDDVEVEVNQTNQQATLNKPDIYIQLDNLIQLNKFIGLADTPLYYDEGKFFKVHNNKLVYTGIEWADIEGEISDVPELYEQFKEIAKQYSEAFIIACVRDAIQTHNTDTSAHASILEAIQTLSQATNNKFIQVNSNIDYLLTKVRLITSLQEDVNDIVDRLNGLSNTVSSHTSTISTLNTLLQAQQSQLESTQSLLNQTINNLGSYALKNELEQVAFTANYYDLKNIPTFPDTSTFATRTYVDNKVAEAIGQQGGIGFVVEESLPATGKSNLIYLIPHDKGVQNIYDEYIWYNNKWELIGTTGVDLSNYYKKNQVDNLLNGKVDKENGARLFRDDEAQKLASLFNYNDESLKAKIKLKQDKLVAGSNIQINPTTNVISATNTTYRAGGGIGITDDNVIYNLYEKAVDWGKIKGDINDQVDLVNKFADLDSKVIHIAGNETINGTKTFTSPIKANVEGDVTGNLVGDVQGDVNGNLTGNVTGNLTGDVQGDVVGNVTGNLTGNVQGNVQGNVTGNLVGNVQGDVVGNVTGNVKGNVDGNASTATKATQDSAGHTISSYFMPTSFGVSGTATYSDTSNKTNIVERGQSTDCYITNFKVLNSSRNHFLNIDLDPAWTISCNKYSAGIFFNGYYDMYSNAVDTSTFPTDPCVITIEKNANIDATDVLQLNFIHHRGRDCKHKKSIKVEVKCTDNNWYTAREFVDQELGNFSIGLCTPEIKQATGAQLNYVYIKGVRITISKWDSVYFTLAEIELRESRGTTPPNFGVNAIGRRGDVMYGNYYPVKTNTFDIGTNSNKWKNIYATNIYGLSEKATSDENGNNIVNTYATKTELQDNRATITYWGD